MVNQTNANASNVVQSGQAIDKLLDFFVANDGTAYYQVKWKPTWERADALLQFTDLMDSFWEFVNNAHNGNLYNNQSIHKGPAPDLPVLPPSTFNNEPVSNTASTKSKQKKNSVLTPPQKQFKTLSSSQKKKPLPSSKPSFVEAVVIDSDDEDVTEVTAPNSVASLQNNIPFGDAATSMQGHQQHLQQFSPMSATWNMNVQTKTEPTDILEQKPFQQNQQGCSTNNFNQPHQIQQTTTLQQPLAQQQFPFPVQNVPNTNNRGRGGRGRGRGRGRGTVDTGAKRKLTEPPVSNPNQHLTNVKFESSDEMPSQSNENFGNNWEAYDLNDSSNDSSGGKWEDSFEIIEKKNFDGTSLETQYKCTICSTVISNKSSCRRHYNIHSGQKSHKCPICDKAFHRLDYMQRHLKVHGQGGGKELEGLIKLAMEGVKK